MSLTLSAVATYCILGTLSLCVPRKRTKSSLFAVAFVAAMITGTIILHNF